MLSCKGGDKEETEEDLKGPAAADQLFVILLTTQNDGYVVVVVGCPLGRPLGGKIALGFASVVACISDHHETSHQREFA